jgi:hypothetical protein
MSGKGICAFIASCPVLFGARLISIVQPRKLFAYHTPGLFSQYMPAGAMHSCITERLALYAKPLCPD